MKKAGAAQFLRCFEMQGRRRWVFWGMTAVAALAMGLFTGIELDSARAGGISQTPGGNIVTANEAGDVLYEWILTPGHAEVVRYSYATGKAERRALTEQEAAPVPEEKPTPPPAEVEKPEICITGVIWVADPEKRVAIINGAPVREGEIFETKSGKRYRVTEIKKTDEVAYEEVKD